MRELLTIPYCPEVPTPTQAAFLLDPSREALYGGAAGGGKSSALLMGALQGVEVPGFAAIIFRRTLADLKLPGALIDRSHQWIGSPARWSADDHTWTFPSGATISFGYLDTEFGHLRYQGAEFQYIAFDELTQFREVDFRYLFSRLRRPHDASRLLGEVPPRMRAATNPGGPGHDWVRRRFIEPWLAHQLDPTITLDRSYHPALLADNPYLDIDAYGEMLDQLDPVTRAQLRDGNWDIRPDGRLFQRAWFGTEPRRDVPDDVAMVRFWDLAATPKTPGQRPRLHRRRARRPRPRRHLPPHRHRPVPRHPRHRGAHRRAQPPNATATPLRSSSNKSPAPPAKPSCTTTAPASSTATPCAPSRLRAANSSGPNPSPPTPKPGTSPSSTAIGTTRSSTRPNSSPTEPTTTRSTPSPAPSPPSPRVTPPSMTSAASPRSTHPSPARAAGTPTTRRPLGAACSPPPTRRHQPRPPGTPALRHPAHCCQHLDKAHGRRANRYLWADARDAGTLDSRHAARFAPTMSR